MPARSDKTADGRVVRRSASVPPRRTRADLARLDAAMRGAVDTTDIAERPTARKRVYRDAAGRLPSRPPSTIRDAILSELGRRQLTRRALWERAAKHCPDLPESAVYEFLRGQRQIGVTHVDALLAALDLTVAAA